MPCHYLKQIAKNRSFVERPSIISKIDKALNLAGNQSIRSFALCGLGGMGKTQLAMHYALARQDVFDAVFWVLADEPIKISRSFCEIAKALHLAETSKYEDPTVSRDLVLEWLSDPRMMPAQAAPETNLSSGLGLEGKTGRASWLLIFDDVDDFNLVRPYWPTSSHGQHRASILVTSRHSLAKSELAIDGVDLPPMTTKECITLLGNQLGLNDVPERTQSTAKNLVEKIGCLPLMITTLASRIRQSGMSIQEFSQRYEQQGMLHELAKVNGLRQHEQYRHTLDTVWRFETLEPKARGLLYVMIFLDNDAVPDFLLEQDVSYVVRELKEATGGQIFIDYPGPDEEYIEARSVIMQTSLVHCHETSQFLSWHRIVQEVVTWQMGNDTKSVFFELVIHLLYEAWLFNQDRFTAEDIQNQKRSNLLPHILRMAKSFGGMARNQEMPLRTAQKLVKLLQTASLYLVQTLQLAQVEKLLELGVQICRDRGDTMQDLLADVYFTYTRYGAVTNMGPEKVYDYCQRFYDICKVRDDGSISAREDVATAHTILATGFLLLDSFSNAVEHCQRCIDLESSLPDHTETGAISQFALIYQAWAYIGLGQYEHAAQQAQYVIDYRNSKFGLNDNNSDKLGLALQCLGRARELQDRKRECVDIYLRAKRNYSVVGSADYFRNAQVSLKLGELYSNPTIEGNYFQYAPQFINEAINTFRKNSVYKRELARALFKKHQCEILRGQAQQNSPSLLEAQLLYRELCPDCKKSKQDLASEDFDKLVRFWSR